MKNQIIGLLSVIILSSIIIIIQTAEATGGAGQIKNLVDPMIERAITALENNNTDAALTEILDLQKELNDTFEEDKEEQD